MPDPTPVAGNPFSLVAYVLFKVRYSLEEYDGSRPPRWVRIARGREFQSEAIGTLVSAAVLGLSESTTLMADLTIRIEELLIQTDAAKAIAETTLDFIEAASSNEFAMAVTTLVSPSFSSQVADALDQINTTAQSIEALLDYIPEPEDVRQLGHELFQLLCIVQRTGVLQPTDTDHVDLEATGKVRLCAWAYGRRVRARALGPSSVTADVLQLGMRRLVMGVTTNTHSEGVWEGPEEPITIFEHDFVPPYGDFTELVALLAAHDYTDPLVQSSITTITNPLRRLLLQFQFLNELPLSGEVDDHTLNRLMNYDFARKNLRRARSYDPNADWPWATTTPTPPVPVVWGGELPLVNPGADDYADEGITPMGMPYSYYEVRTEDAIGPVGNLPQGHGWVADSNALRSFVALRSRTRTPDAQVATQGRYDGGVWSEGEAADGLYFWSARHVEPWRAGRTGAPLAGALFGSFGAAAPAAAQQSRMYQWIPVPASMLIAPIASVPSGTTARLYVVASVLQRSLYRDRGSAGLPDQGRIRLEVYDNTYYSPPSNALSPRDLGEAVASAQTQWFPDRGTTAMALQLDEVDRRRVWFLRKTEPLDLTGIANITALCLVAEGLHQSGWDTDAYFDDFRVEYYWRIVPIP